LDSRSELVAHNEIQEKTVTTKLFGALLIAAALTLLNSLGMPQSIAAVPQESGRADHKNESIKGEEGKAHAHGKEDEHGEEEANSVRLTANQVELAGIESEPAKTGRVATELRLNGEIVLNQDRVAEIVPRVPGVVQEVRGALGSDVNESEVLAIIQSRELADSVADYLAARERLTLAQTRFEREELLFKKRISAEQEYLEVRQALAEARITLRTAEQKLRAVGLSQAELLELSQRPNEVLTRYSLAAPFAGTIIEKHLTQGELVTGEDPLFRIAQLDKVWAMASVYPKDISSIAVGQSAVVTVQSYQSRTFVGSITWVGAVIDQQTRTLPIRIELDNPDRLLKAGMFAQIAVAVASTEGAIVIPTSALQMQKGAAIVFVAKEGGEYERREVEIGAKSSQSMEILKGLQNGDQVVTRGAFTLRSELEKSGFEAGHGH
jgi:cobalt-zinc-cadmium efflux system membrane fusion protein